MVNVMANLGWRSLLKRDRFYRVLGQGWYVRTREGLVGPYPYRSLAERHLELVKHVFKDKRQPVPSKLTEGVAALSR